ncbi:MAG: hypothetical protein M3371_06170 [Acidobacteriota bacterium]|nr:hypothetical protein [Acidobacteriota bacterium]
MDENPDRINEAKFLELALAEFPSLAEEFAEEEGLFHLQVAALSRFTQAAIERNDRATLQRCYSLLEEMVKSATFEVQNAIYVSFLENLNFETSSFGAEARRLLPPALSKMLVELEEHWQQIGEWQVQAQDNQQRAREEKARKR